MDTHESPAEGSGSTTLLDSLAEGAPGAAAIPAKKSRGQDGTGRSTSLTPESTEEDLAQDERAANQSDRQYQNADGSSQLGLIDVDEEGHTGERDQLDFEEDEHEDEGHFAQNESHGLDKFASKSRQQDLRKGGFQQKYLDEEIRQRYLKEIGDVFAPSAST
ncbi:hypothetical protein IE81DRAFT_366410 [Ceraceosorus guamensis]|uniref:Uncharacterized protein n=1 Tax=Ceraceosorus guamensis TaxID=1522189 RepID=A0A316W4W6_9BASI|nr:hypothetical protein IE81DRAFT_366410 [Ceraceosorus guamensis]PWN42665.1 hypothetical protein IE81DRAFT_366410 [Ceraceosorus guamensis]